MRGLHGGGQNADARFQGNKFMAKKTTVYVCRECGATQPKWSGRCDACGQWNTIEEDTPVAAPAGGRKGNAGRGKKIDFADLSGTGTPPARLKTGIGEMDRVCGGGLVEGGVLLVGGDPGIGKSTLLLQATAALAGGGRVCAYLTGEEAVEQVRLRARRLGVAGAPVQLAAETSVEDILATLDVTDATAVAVIDSMQTRYTATLDSAPGTVSQVRSSAQALIRVAKKRGIVLVLIGHVTKEGAIAGPRVLEHMVDTVLTFEGERGHQFRILRSVKNRYGPTDEIGVFEMTEKGLEEVENPSALFLAERRGNISGACVFAGMEGTRPVLVEIQALAAPAGGNPRRAVVGWDTSRLSMVVAVLEARCGFPLSGYDLFLNVAGGLRISEPAADLAVATALISAATDVPVPADMAVFGEIGLSGEIRAVPQAEQRLKEAEKLGFSGALGPKRRKGKVKSPMLQETGHLQDVVERFRKAAT